MNKENSNKIPAALSNVRALKNNYLQKELNKIGFKGIVPSHGAILYFLTQNGDMTMTELSEIISKDRSTITALISKLIKKDMVEYRENPEDKRSKIVQITKKGKLFEKELINISNRMNEKLLNNISDDENEIFNKVLLKMKDNLTNME